MMEKRRPGIYIPPVTPGMAETPFVGKFGPIDWEAMKTVGNAEEPDQTVIDAIRPPLILE